MDLQTDKKKYIKPITESINVIFENFMAKSANAENFSSHIDGENDDWGNVKPPDPDPDEEIETFTLYDLIREVSFEDVFSRICFYYPSQCDCKEGYEKAFNELLGKKQKKHRIDDLFINVEIVEDEDEYYLEVTGLNTKSGVHYGIELCKWTDWLTMFITKETLDRLSKEDIVAGCLYELTFFGFTENKVLERKDKMVDDIKKMKNKDGVN